MADLILEAQEIVKSFVQPGRERLVILRGLSLAVERGRTASIAGASGSGKSTLLHLLGSLDEPDRGIIRFEGEELATFSRRRLAAYRNRDIGFVFQFHYLMPELTLRENVAAPGLVQSFRKRQALDEAGALLAEVGLGDRLDAMPYQLSGGEKQRAAIARSLLNDPRLLLADEPTGSLDWKTGEAVFAVLQRLIRERGLTAVIATHNPQLAQLTDKRYVLHGGQLEEI
ncbi:MAG TPA: ABC transporter ATP-binding protein [Candidatus Aminicenantes bacterium]|nr:ABC transporter ATP-binding protein [Candidatus Aminicenantes bacterium]